MVDWEGCRGKQCGVNMNAVLKTLTFPREPFPPSMIIIIIVSIFLITSVRRLRETIDGPNSTKSCLRTATTQYMYGDSYTDVKNCARFRETCHPYPPSSYTYYAFNNIFKRSPQNQIMISKKFVTRNLHVKQM